MTPALATALISATIAKVVTDANSLPETITFSNYQSSAFAMALYQGN
jgi:hypothetical protein